MNLFRTLAIFVVEMITIERLNKKKRKKEVEVRNQLYEVLYWRLQKLT